MKVNGKEYTMWGGFVEKKEEWIGGILEDHDMGEVHPTKIIDIELRPNGKDSAFFEVIGEDFGCGFSVEVGGLEGSEGEWTKFCGYGGHQWRIKKPEKPLDIS